ncbi:MAG: ATP-binding protein [bacterium]
MLNEDEKFNLLVVEDKPDIINILKSTLDNQEVNLLQSCFRNGALNSTLKRNLGLILMDISGEEQNKVELSRKIIDVKKAENVPFIFVSENNKDNFLLRGYDLGAVDCLRKPLQPKILKSKITVFLNLFKQKQLLENQALELEKKMTDLSMVLMYLQEKEQLLEQQARELKKINQELNDFAYVVSHDLKAPLRAINCLATWLYTDHVDSFNEQAKEQLNLLLGRVKRMHDLIDGILVYSRIGRIKDQKVQVDLNELVQEVIDLLAPPENVTIEILNKLPTVQFERIRIEQVFQNIISNSIKYIDKPRGVIKIASVECPDHWEISIEDNGPGIDEQHFQKVFQIFQTLTPQSDYENTGIGLSLVKKIIENSGGEIWIESNIGKRTKFIFTVKK